MSSSPLAKKQQQQQQHVAVLAFPFGTHGAPLLTLVQRLAKAAPNVLFSFFCAAKSNASLFSATGPDNVKAYDVHNGVPEGYEFAGKPQEDINLFLNVAPESFRKGVEAAEKEVGRKVSCLIADAFLWFTCEMAEEIGVPWLAFWTSGAAPLSAHLHTDLIRQAVGLDGTSEHKDEFLTFIPGFSNIPLADLPSGVVFGNLQSPFSQMLHKMGHVLPRAKAVIINSFEELDPPITKYLKTKFAKYLNVGPSSLVSQPPLSSSVSDPHGCIAWLDQQKTRSVAYIGFGTVATPPPHELKALAEALQVSKIPFVWSLKDGLKSDLLEEFLGKTMEVGIVVPWAPQVQILRHRATGAFITHCGWNSVVESISGGVPIIGRPFLGDQQLNVSVVERVWRIGVRIKGGVFTKNGAIKALEMVLLKEEGMKMKERAEMLRELAVKSVAPNGSSTRNFETLLSMFL